MSLTLASVALALGSVVTDLGAVETAATSVITVSQKVFSYAASMMDTVEKAYEGIADSGAGKKAAVLVAVQAFVVALGANWTDFENLITTWIDSVKSAFNSLKAATTAAPKAA